MPVAIVGDAALEALRCMRQKGMMPRRCAVASLEGFASTVRELDELGAWEVLRTLGVAPTTSLDVLVPGGLAHSNASRIVRRAWSGPLPPRSFVSLGHGVYVASPEFCALLLTRSHNVHEVAMVVAEFCGSYSVLPDPTRRKFVQREPVTSMASFQAFAAGTKGGFGVRHLREAIFLADGGMASPLEASSRSWLCQRVGRGGFGCACGRVGVPVCNAPVEVMGGSRRIPDLLWTKSMKGLECDGGQHDEARQRASDALREMELAEAGIVERRVSWRVLGEYNAACRFGNSFREFLGLPPIDLGRPTDATRPASRDVRLEFWKSIVGCPWARYGLLRE